MEKAMEKPDLLKPALISGVIFGLASAIPVINFFNCMCCALIFACGIFSSFLVMRQHYGTISYGTGALAGLLAGIFGAFTATIVDTLIQITMGRRMKELFLTVLEDIQSKMPPEMVTQFEFFEKQMQKDFTLFDMIIGFFIWLIIFMAFSTLGGILGVALFGKKKRTQQTPSEGNSL